MYNNKYIKKVLYRNYIHLSNPFSYLHPRRGGDGGIVSNQVRRGERALNEVYKTCYLGKVISKIQSVQE